MFPDYYSLLQVSPEADVKEIMQAYHKLFSFLRPLSIDSQDASRRIRDIIEARIILSSEQNRKRYVKLYPKFNECSQNGDNFICTDQILLLEINKAKQKAKSELLWLKVNVTTDQAISIATDGAKGAKEGVKSSLKAFLIWWLLIGGLLLIIYLMGKL